MTSPDADAVSTSLRDDAANAAARGLGSGFMVICQVALGITLLLLWQGASGRLVDNFFISNPLDVGTRLIGWIADGSLFLHMWATIYATLMGFMVGSIGGLILGIWLGVSPFTSRLLNPYLNALNALPKVALAPLFVLWFGLGIESKIALAAVLVLFLVFLNTYAGVREVDQDLIELGAAHEGDACAGHRQGDRSLGDVVGFRGAENLGALCADRGRAWRNDRRKPWSGLPRAVLRLAIRFRRGLRCADRDRTTCRCT